VVVRSAQPQKKIAPSAQSCRNAVGQSQLPAEQVSAPVKPIIGQYAEQLKVVSELYQQV